MRDFPYWKEGAKGTWSDKVMYKVFEFAQIKDTLEKLY